MACCRFSILELTSLSTGSGGKDRELIKQSWGVCLSSVQFQNRDEHITEFHKPHTPLRNPSKSAELHHDLVTSAIWTT